MALRVIGKSDIEELATALVADLKSERAAKGRFEFLRVAVANPNLGNWLKMKVLAKVPELSAGIEMPFLDDRLEGLLKAILPEGDEYEVVSGRKYPAEILAEILSSGDPVYKPFWNYISDGAEVDRVPVIDSMRRARKVVQLAHKLGELIDAYEGTGYLGTLAEIAGGETANAVAKAEQKLVEVLFGTADRPGRLSGSRGSLRQLFERVKAGLANPNSNFREPKAESIILFGYAQLTPLQIQILAWLAKRYAVTLYYPGVVDAANVGKPESWHVANRKTLEMLKECLQKEGVELQLEKVGENQPTSHVLSVLQEVLQGGTCSNKLPQDASVQIIGTPGIRREVEMVYNAILGAVWEKNAADGTPQKRGNISFSDFAVLVPDMKTYRTMIESVFEGRGQIPYALVSSTARETSAYLDGFLALMDLTIYGLNRKRLFAVLENPCVQLAMGFTTQDVVSWRDLTEKIGAFDGYEQADSDEKNNSGQFNWKDALSRLRLGQVAEDIDGLQLEAYDADDAARFSVVVETLYRKLRALKDLSVPCYSSDEKAWPETWAGRLHDIMDDFLDVDSENVLELSVRSQIVRALNSLQTVEGPHSFMLSVAMVEHAVSAQEGATGGYLRHGVTIGGLRALAHVPFKQIFVLGLGEGGLPGRADRSTLDVRTFGEDGERKDVLRPDENRALFLAAVLSARDRLVLSYPNRNLAENAPLYPSSLVRDIERRVLDVDVLTHPFEEFKGYPLVESASATNEDENAVLSAVSGEVAEEKFRGLLPSYSKTARLISREGKAKDVESGSSSTQPTAKDLAEFVKDPFPAILKRRFEIAQKGYRDASIENDSPLGVSKGPLLWGLEEAMLKGGFSDEFKKAQSTGQVPGELLGAFARKGLDEINNKAQALLDEQDRKVLEEQKPSDAYRIICRKFDEKVIPPDAILQPFFEFLMSPTRLEDEDSRSLRIKLVNVEEGNQAEWTWEFTVLAGRKYLEGVRAAYDAYCQKSKGSPLTYASVSYKDLRAKLETVDNIDWKNVQKKLSEKSDWEPKDKKGFDSSVVVKKLMKDWSRLPSSDELEELYKKLFKFPMAGKKATNQNSRQADQVAQ